jgi:hypothetical protein
MSFKEKPGFSNQRGNNQSQRILRWPSGGGRLLIHALSFSPWRMWLLNLVLPSTTLMAYVCLDLMT